jgi:hypothetical protein
MAYLYKNMSNVTVTGTSIALLPNHSYIANNAALVTLTLPTTAQTGDLIKIVGKGAGLWKVAQNVGQVIYFGNASSTSGVTGYISSTLPRDCVYLYCISSTEWQVDNAVGSINVS